MSVNIDIEKFEKAVTDSLTYELLQLGTALAGEISRNTPVASNALAGSFAAQVGQIPGDGVNVTVGSPLWNTYGAHVEFGTKPHWVPLEPLITWVKEKNLDRIENYIKTGSAARKTNKTSLRGEVYISRGRMISAREAQVLRIASMIRSKISKVGTKQQLYVLKSIMTIGLPYYTSFSGEAKYMLDVSGYLKERNIWGTIGGKL